MTLTTVTRDAILDPSARNQYAADVQGRGYYAHSSASKAWWQIVARNVADDDHEVLYGISENTGNVVRIVRTGNVVDRNKMVRVRIEFSTDTGDAAGTIAFDSANRVGGAVNIGAFPWGTFGGSK